MDTPGNLAFRAMTEADLAAVRAIERGSYDFPWSEGIFRDCLRAGYDFRLLLCDQEVVGYGILSVAAGEAHVLNLCILRDRQRQGLGKQLLQHLMDRARAAGAVVMLLEVRQSNLVGQALYEGLGFARIGIRRGYYPGADGREDAVVLEKKFEIRSPRPASGT